MTISNQCRCIIYQALTFQYGHYPPVKIQPFYNTTGGYSISGQKTYISGVEEADGILVVVRKREDDRSLSVPMLAIVDVDAPGLEKQQIPTVEPGANKQWQLFFDGVEVEHDRIVGGETAGLKAAFDGLNPERIMGAAVCNGTARRALGLASEYARTRQVWKGPIPIRWSAMRGNRASTSC